MILTVRQSKLPAASTDPPNVAYCSLNVTMPTGVNTVASLLVRAYHIFRDLGALAMTIALVSGPTQILGCRSKDQDTEATSRTQKNSRTDERSLVELRPRPPGSSLPEEETLEYRKCSRDEDCVYVNNGCCHCQSRSADLAVNKDRADDFQKHLNCPSPPLPCTLIQLIPPCGIGRISCDDGLCVYHMPPPSRVP